LVTRIRFQPLSDFRTSTTDEDAVATATSEVLTFVYSAANNTSKDPGKHGLYDRTLTTPIQIPAHSSRLLRVVIEDPKHLGWGLQGDLLIDYNGRKGLRVHDVPVVLRAPTS
jgi:hypothetical protein